jgi:hypothetical protein
VASSNPEAANIFPSRETSIVRANIKRDALK